MSEQNKRSFPYYSAVPSIDLKRRAVEGINPGQEGSSPIIFHAPALAEVEGPRATDFTSWTDDQIKGFLDQRGEDYDDCQTRGQLVQRAAECEQATGPASKPAAAEEEADDPLDAFMAEIQQTAANESQQPKAHKADWAEEDDNVADFMEARERNGTAQGVFFTDGNNSDDEVYATDKAIQQAQGQEEEPPEGRQQIGPLAPLDHDSIVYEPFAKDFYTPVAKIAAMKPGEVNAMRRQLGVRVSGFDAPGPVDSFQQCGLPTAIMAVLRKAGYEKPTAIQAQALPAALSGRDILGIAKTGSGKTAAFVLPMVVHIQDQPQLEKGEGPIGVIVAPTRELAQQIHKEARRFGKPFDLRIAAAVGGLSKHEQFKDLRAGSDAAVCTPGRLIDLIKMKACTLHRTTYLVFDEADRMFDMGFEPQVRSIIGQVRPDRQTLLFSATMPTKVEKLVRDALTSPVRVTVGEVGAANEDIKQVVDIVEEHKKLDWLLARLPAWVDSGEVLVFANHIARVEEVMEKLKAAGHRAVMIHGDMDQHSRAAALREFSAGRQHVLVATDVAARGLDIKSIRNVVNLDAAKDIDTHVHRVGRTGRAGDKEGTAHTLLTPKQSHFAGLLVNSMAAANQEITAALQDLAMRDSGFRKGQMRNKAGGKFSASGNKRRQQVGGAGIGFGPSQDDPLKELYGDRAGFSRGGDLSTTTPTAPAPAAQPAAAVAHPAAAVAHPAAAVAAPSGFVAASHSNPVLGRSQPKGPPPPQTGQATVEQPAAGGVFGGQGLKHLMHNRFKSQFVTSGTTGGDLSQKATIIAPKQAAQRQQEPAAVPSFLAKKMNAQPANQQAQQAIAAARAIAARLAGGGGAEAPHPPIQPQPQVDSMPGVGGRRPAFNPPPGLGASASYYPDLSRDRSDRDRDRGQESSRARPDAGFGSGPPAASSYPGRQRSDHRGPTPEAGFGASASSHPDLPRDRDRSRGSAFSDGPGAGPSPAAAAGLPNGQATAAPGNPYAAQYGAVRTQPAASVAQTYGTPLGGPPSQSAPQPGNLQASIAAAQAIAARLTAQAGGAPAPAQPAPGPPRLGGIGSGPPVPDSVQASIEAAKAIAARFSGHSSSSSSALGTGTDASNSGQWAWRKS